MQFHLGTKWEFSGRILVVEKFGSIPNYEGTDPGEAAENLQLKARQLFVFQEIFGHSWLCKERKGKKSLLGWI